MPSTFVYNVKPISCAVQQVEKPNIYFFRWNFSDPCLGYGFLFLFFTERKDFEINLS